MYLGSSWISISNTDLVSSTFRKSAPRACRRLCIAPLPGILLAWAMGVMFPLPALSLVGQTLRQHPIDMQ